MHPVFAALLVVALVAPALAQPGDPVAGEQVFSIRRFSASPADIPEAEPTVLASDTALDPATLALEGDPEYGEYLAGECTACHQADGGTQGIPSIVHWPEEDFVIAMHAYKTKQRAHPVMQMIAGRLGDEEIAALAAYFANIDQ